MLAQLFVIDQVYLYLSMYAPNNIDVIDEKGRMGVSSVLDIQELH